MLLYYCYLCCMCQLLLMSTISYVKSVQITHHQLSGYILFHFYHTQWSMNHLIFLWVFTCSLFVTFIYHCIYMAFSIIRGGLCLVIFSDVKSKVQVCLHCSNSQGYGCNILSSVCSYQMVKLANKSYIDHLIGHDVFWAVRKKGSIRARCISVFA